MWGIDNSLDLKGINMNPIIVPNQPQVEGTQAAQPSSSNATTAGAVASSNAPAGYTSSTTVKSMEDLKNKAPKVYNAMMQGIASSMISRMHDQQEHLKEMMRKGREDSR